MPQIHWTMLEIMSMEMNWTLNIILICDYTDRMDDYMPVLHIEAKALEHLWTIKEAVSNNSFACQTNSFLFKLISWDCTA